MCNHEHISVDLKLDERMNKDYKTMKYIPTLTNAMTLTDTLMHIDTVSLFIL